MLREFAGLFVYPTSLSSSEVVRALLLGCCEFGEIASSEAFLLVPEGNIVSDGLVTRVVQAILTLCSKRCHFAMWIAASRASESRLQLFPRIVTSVRFVSGITMFRSCQLHLSFFMP